jgi:hypothetical protein
MSSPPPESYRCLARAAKPDDDVWMLYDLGLVEKPPFGRTLERDCAVLENIAAEHGFSLIDHVHYVPIGAA